MKFLSIKYRSYSDLTKKEIKSIENNDDFRCGTTMNKIFRLPQFCFLASCKGHDFGYRQGGLLLQFIKVNNGFVKKMFIDIWNKDDAFFNKVFYYLMAVIYYIAVSIFGIFAFNWTCTPKTLKEILNKYDKEKKQ